MIRYRLSLDSSWDRDFKLFSFYMNVSIIFTHMVLVKAFKFGMGILGLRNIIWVSVTFLIIYQSDSAHINKPIPSVKDSVSSHSSLMPVCITNMEFIKDEGYFIIRIGRNRNCLYCPPVGFWGVPVEKWQAMWSMEIHTRYVCKNQKVRRDCRLRKNLYNIIKNTVQLLKWHWDLKKCATGKD